MHSDLRLGKLQDTFVPSGKDQHPHRCLLNINAGRGGLLFHLQACAYYPHDAISAGTLGLECTAGSSSYLLL